MGVRGKTGSPRVATRGLGLCPSPIDTCQKERSMQPEATTPPDSNGAPKGLPPVAPPSGRFIAQLFLVPGLIVMVAVFIYLGSSYLVRSSHTPERFLKDLDSDNPEIRWRGAHDLAQ